MKLSTFTIALFLIISQLNAQKGQSTQATNLNSSRSNAYRLIYPAGLFSAPNAQSLLIDLEKTHITSQPEIKKWLASHFNNYGGSPVQIKQISFFREQTKACKACYLHCKGVCVPEPGNEKEGCLCISIFSSTEDNIKLAAEKSVTIIFLSVSILDDATTLDQVQRTFKASKPNSDN